MHHSHCDTIRLLADVQEHSGLAAELATQQDLNNRAQRDVERFLNREQLLAKVPLHLDACSPYHS